MQVGILELTLVIRGAHSLKEKRRALKALKDQIRNRWNVSVAEVEDHDNWQRTVIGIAWVGNDGQFLTSALSKIVDHARQYRGAELADHYIEIL